MLFRIDIGGKKSKDIKFLVNKYKLKTIMNLN